MIVEFKNNICLKGIKDILIKDGKKLLKIFYGNSGDLYFDIFGDHNIDNNNPHTASFTIKQYEEVYQHFEELIHSIINCKVFDTTEIELEFCNPNDPAINEINEKLKVKPAYNKLVHNNTIIWYSDNTYDENANILKIEKNNNEIKLTFTDNPNDQSFGFSIRISNSGSKYDPFNICFMNFFKKLQLLSKEEPVKKLARTHKGA